MAWGSKSSSVNLASTAYSWARHRCRGLGAGFDAGLPSQRSASPCVRSHSFTSACVTPHPAVALSPRKIGSHVEKSRALSSRESAASIINRSKRCAQTRPFPCWEAIKAATSKMKNLPASQRRSSFLGRLWRVLLILRTASLASSSAPSAATASVHKGWRLMLSSATPRFVARILLVGHCPSPLARPCFSKPRQPSKGTRFSLRRDRRQ